MSFKSHEGFGQVAAVRQASNSGVGAPVPWWAGSQLVYGESAALSPEETRRDGQFQIVPRAQGFLDPAPQPVPKRGAPEVLKFSVFQGEVLLVPLEVCGLIARIWHGIVGSVHTTMPVKRRESHKVQLSYCLIARQAYNMLLCLENKLPSSKSW